LSVYSEQANLIAPLLDGEKAIAAFDQRPGHDEAIRAGRQIFFIVLA